MLEQFENRLQALEKTIGADDAKSADVDVSDLRRVFAKKGLNAAFKVEAEKLLKLKEFTTKPDGRPLSEKLSVIQCCEDLMRRRVELLEDFENRLKVVLNTDDLSGISSHEEKLSSIESDIEAALALWKQSTIEIEEFKKEYAMIVSSLQAYVHQLSQKVAFAELKAVKADSSDA